MSQKIKNAQKFLTNLGKKSIKTQKRRNNSHKNFLEFSNGMKQVSKYNRLIHQSKKTTNPKPYTRSRWILRQSQKLSNNMPIKSEELENKLTNYKELYLLAKEELSEVKKNEENRLRMILEDLKVFEEKRREIILTKEQRDDSGKWLQPPQQYAEEKKIQYINKVINHLKLYLGISPEDLCIINKADEGLERWEASKRRGRPIPYPYKIQIVDLSKGVGTTLFSGDVTREEYIDAVKKGIAYRDGIDPNALVYMKQNLLDKTIEIVGRIY